MKAPDYAEPFYAWRAWRVVRRDGGYCLGSVVQRTIWKPREAFVADCLRMPKLFSRLRRKETHDSPDLYCDCGIYAAPLDRIGEYLADPPLRPGARVLGLVALWGTVIECQNGFRASHAYPARIYVPADAGGPWRLSWTSVAVGLWSYGVPVEPLPARAAEATRHLHDRQAA
jgi:hypothetical protein